MGYVDKLESKTPTNKEEFLFPKMYSDLYDFLWQQGALKDATEKLKPADRVAFEPWNDDLFTAYKTILYAMILTELYPWPHEGHANIYLKPYSAIEEIYKKRNLEPLADIQLDCIETELHRIAKGYAAAIENACIDKRKTHMKL